MKPHHAQTERSVDTDKLRTVKVKITQRYRRSVRGSAMAMGVLLGSNARIAWARKCVCSASAGGLRGHACDCAMGSIQRYKKSAI